MLIKNGTITGVVVGVIIAVVMISLDNLRLFSVPVNDFVDSAIFKVCPLYILGFSNAISSKAVWFLVTILGNALLYGLLGLLIGAGWIFFRKTKA